MKRHLPLLVSACIAVTFAALFLEWDHMHNPVGRYNGAANTPAVIMIVVTATGLLYGFFLIARRALGYLKNQKGHQLSNFL